MVERRIELDRRYHRKKKMAKLKAKLKAGATGPDREKILYKIKRLSPQWTEASLTQGDTPAAAPAEPKKKAPPKPKKA
jgi:hypothetical protein